MSVTSIIFASFIKYNSNKHKNAALLKKKTFLQLLHLLYKNVEV